MSFSHGISPLDGRYGERMAPLRRSFSEFALMERRVEVELRYLLALESVDCFEPLSADERGRLDDALGSFGAPEFQRLKEIESELNHDVKAVEVFLRERLRLKNPNRIHFGLTSEDINNLAYTLCLKDYVEHGQLPLWRELLQEIAERAHKWAEIPFPTRTHGQFASPSTAGKELAVYLTRGVRLFKVLRAFRFTGKLGGATGNFSAMQAACPAVDWRRFAGDFVESLDLSYNGCTTQVEDHDNWAHFFNLTRAFNNVIQDLDLDFWLYISYGYLKEATRQGEVGSSTMPHKVNPIRFENSEGNLQVANSLLTFLSDKLPRSRMQRDLSDSTVTRNIGVALGHSHLAWQETLRGLARVDVDQERCLEELEQSPELLSEPIQSILRLVTNDDPYTLLKTLTRGKEVTTQALAEFIDELDVDEEVRARLRALSVTGYLGLAPEICLEACKLAREELTK